MKFKKILLLVVSLLLVNFAAGTAKAQSTAQFLSDWATTNQKKMPLILNNNVQLTGTTTQCQSGCQVMGIESVARFTAVTPNQAVPSVTISDLARDLHGAFLTEYCSTGGSDMRARNIKLEVRFFDMNATAIGFFDFGPSECSSAGSTNSGSGGTNTSSPRSTASTSGRAGDQQLWDAVKSSTNAADYQLYLDSFPNGSFAAVARFKRDQLSQSSGNLSSSPSNTNNNNADERFWDSVKNSQNIAEIQLYLDKFPIGEHRDEADLRIAQIRGNTRGSGLGSGSSVDPADERMWDRIKFSRDVKDFETYVAIFPGGSHRSEAQQRISQLQSGSSNPIFGGAGSVGSVDPADQRMWDRIKFSRDVRDFDNYLAIFPTGSFRFDAQQKVNQLRAISNPSFGTGSIDPADQRMWDRIKFSQDIRDFQNYVAIFPAGNFRFEADRNIDRLTPRTTTVRVDPADQRMWDRIKFSRDVRDFQNYIAIFPSGSFRFDAQQKINQLSPAAVPPAKVMPSGRTEAQVLAAAQIGNLSELAKARKFFISEADLTVKTKITNAMQKEVPQLQAAAGQSDADFFIGITFTDRTTGAVTAYDASNANLKASMVIFTVTRWVNNSPFDIRIHATIVKERNFGVFSSTPDESCGKEFAKQFAKIMQ